jgi:tyrosine-protein kinase Etk/Wzc
VLTKLGLNHPSQPYTVNSLVGQVKVEYPRNTNLILLKVQDTSKERAAQIANEWAAAFIERNEEVTSKETGNTYSFIMDQLEKVKVSLKTSEEELEKFQKTNKIELLKEQLSGKIKQIVQYESKSDDAVRSELIEKAQYIELTNQILGDMKLKVEELETNLEKKKIALEKTSEELKRENKYISVDKGLIGKEEINPLYTDLNSRRANAIIDLSVLEKERDELLRAKQALDQEIQQMQEDITAPKRGESHAKKSPTMTKSSSNFNSKRGEQTKTTGTQQPIRQKPIGYANVTYKGLKDALMKSAINIQSYGAEISQLRENIKHLNEEVSGLRKELAEQELTQARLTRSADTAKSTFEILSKKGEETKISSSIKAGTIQVSVPATPPESPIGPRKRQNVMIAGVAGLLASIILAFFIEFLEKNKAIMKKAD